jgi:hypothetical protein
VAQLCRIYDRPNFGFYAFTTEDFGGIYGSNAESDMADIAVGGKIFASKNYAHDLGGLSYSSVSDRTADP